MAVGITILSGARQGEEFGFDQPEFRAGDNPACEVFFDAQRDAGAARQQALFRLGDDGWYVKNTGEGPLLVNNGSVEGSTRLRSGDVVRLSPLGPEFVFKLLSRLPVSGQKPVAAGSSPSPAAPVAAREPDAQAEAPAPLIRDWRFPAALVIGSLLGLAVLYAVMRPSETSNTIPSVASIERARGSVSPPTMDTPDEETKAGEPIDTANEDIEDRDIAPIAPAKSKDSRDDAILLILVEEPKSASAWPFGAASAIADRMLLTSATVVTGLAEFRHKGWRLWATNQRLGLKTEIGDLRVHAAFANAQGEPEKQIYVDLGILTVADSMPKTLSLANADELADLDRGLPVSLRGYLYEYEPVDRFQTFLPESHVGKIFVMTSLPPSPGGPRLMHVRAGLPGKMYGAPVLNEAGHVLGVFAETALPDPELKGADLHIHYAPVADPTQIERWLKAHDEQWWVPPVPSPKSEVQSPKSGND